MCKFTKYEDENWHGDTVERILLQNPFRLESPYAATQMHAANAERRFFIKFSSWNHILNSTIQFREMHPITNAERTWNIVEVFIPNQLYNWMHSIHTYTFHPFIEATEQHTHNHKYSKRFASDLVCVWVFCFCRIHMTTIILIK